MLRLLQTKWMAIAIGTVVYAITTWICLHPKKLIEGAAGQAQVNAETKGEVVTGPSWNFDSPELNQLIAELKEQREAVRLKGLELQEWEKRLNSERQEIYAVTNSVYRLRSELDTTVTRITEEEAVNLKKLVKVYAAMAPEGAVRILREMEDEQIVKILSQMREGELVPILEALAQGTKDEPKRAAQISDRLRFTVSNPKPKKPASP
jgi:flagellar motility protein MotE (MotC chaperone)